MKYMTSDAGMMVKSIQVVFNLGTDPNQAAINVQNRVASVLITPSISGKRGCENYSRGKYVDVCKSFSTDKNTDQKFYTIMQISMSYLN
jgi:HAE1 family hydrophobic/amphiphilic exporter-1